MRNGKLTFCHKKILEIKKLIDTSATLAVVGLPGLGISLFLKHLATQPLGYSIYIDVFALPNLTSAELFYTLAAKLGAKTNFADESEAIVECKKQLERLIREKAKVIIYFGGFDQLKKGFDHEFFHHLSSLTKGNNGKVTFVFGICKRIDNLISERLMDTDLKILSTIYYLKPYSPQDLIYLLSVYGPKVNLDQAELEKILEQSGGHFQLLQLLLSSERLNDVLADPFVKLAMRNVYSNLTHIQKKNIQSIARRGSDNINDNYLKNSGLVIADEDGCHLFSPIFAEYVRSCTAIKLPEKEKRLFSLLKNNLGKIVSKDEIINTVWKDEAENVSDWALDALIYRLRKNHGILSTSFTIENYKKHGYALLKS